MFGSLGGHGIGKPMIFSHGIICNESYLRA